MSGPPSTPSRQAASTDESTSCSSQVSSRTATVKLHSTDEDGDAFNRGESERMRRATPFPDLSTTFMMELVAELDVSVQARDWRTVEEMLMSLIATELKPGDLTRMAPSDVGGAVLEVEQLRVTNENSFAVRLATVLTSIFCSHLHRLMMARSSVLEKQRKKLKRTQ